MNDRLMHHQAGVQRLGSLGIVVHQPRQHRLVERAPIDADPHRLAELAGLLDHHREIAVLLLAEPDIAGIDPVFRKRLGAGRMVAQQRVADIGSRR